jgi:hypothetical protein
LSMAAPTAQRSRLWKLFLRLWKTVEHEQDAEKGGISGLILRHAQDEAERFQRLELHGELVEPWAA